MKDNIGALGFIIMLIGVAGLDSPSQLIPIILIGIGVVMMLITIATDAIGGRRHEDMSEMRK